MKYCEIMKLAWSVCSDFNSLFDVGTVVEFEGEQVPTAGPAYALDSGQAVVMLEKRNFPVEISKLGVPVV